ncbi:hypothetical protein M011DRAFT_415973 [Sporormia fimetaria CBS 119925]|uniref:HTH TFE/IIEalpha-type domain-containing protein n=1 Tax=Sporormia fimetaria CBS 119925 TaxID=1340428 RepID=A0A6A6VN31_9PLEO|nr:hypothetical protein M011DRAFT_415973 [Sporormia fimetaria CBS 119925]
MATTDPLQLAKTFVRTVVRMFYETEHIVVLDALVFHGALTVHDIVIVLDNGKNQKGAAKIAAKLKEGGLATNYIRQEIREGAIKPQAREYYYIDYRRAIDAIKYRIHKLDTSIKATAAPARERKELACRKCKAQYTHIEVMDSVDFLGRESGFLCKRCGDPLVELQEDAETDVQDLPAVFNRYFAPLFDQLRLIDEVIVPAIEGNDAVTNMVPVPRDREHNPGTKHNVVDTVVTKPQTVKGLATAPTKIEVKIATTDELNEAERAKERERAAKVAAQNQLPSWHTQSTVGGNASTSSQPVPVVTNGDSTINADTEEQKPSVDEANLDDVFAQIEAEQRAKDAAEDEEDDDDDEEDDFEDVIPATTSAPESKRIKLDSSAAPSPAAGITPAASTGDGGDESDEDEFVDV